jgi:hypothetical protein
MFKHLFDEPRDQLDGNADGPPQPSFSLHNFLLSITLASPSEMTLIPAFIRFLPQNV